MLIVGPDWLCDELLRVKPQCLIHLIENTWSHWMTPAVCQALHTHFKLTQYTDDCAQCVMSAQVTSRMYPACSHTLPSISLLSRTLEFPGLLRDFRGVERSRAGPRVTE